MKMILEILKAPSEYTVLQRTMQFDEKGGDIGRNKSCKWVLEDHTKHISNFHAKISYNKNTYYITDISSNGIFFKNPYRKFVKGVAMPLIEGNIISIGMYDIAVKSIDGSIIDDPASGIRDNTFIPDSTFTDQSGIKALDVLSVDTHESSNILSLLGNTSEDAAEILPDMDTIMGLNTQSDEQHNVIIQDSLSVHVDFDDLDPEMKEDENHTQNDLIYRFASKLGVNLYEKSQKEQEIFMDDIAILIKTLFIEMHNTSNKLNHTKGKLGVLGLESNTIFSKTEKISVLFNSKDIDGTTLSVHLKNFFKDINSHNDAFLGAFNQVALKLADRFSPNKIYSSLETNSKFKNPLINKKALAWETYNDKFRYLNNPENGKETILEELRKKYLKIIED